MFIRSASKASRLSFFAQHRTFLGMAGVAMLALYFTPKAAATTTYHATAGHCQNNNPGSDVSWNFVLNPTATNPSTLIGTSNYNIEFAQGECFWSAFASSGNAVSGAKITVEYKFIYNSGEGGSNPAGHAEIDTPFGSIVHHVGNVPGGEQIITGPTTASWTIPIGTPLSGIQVDDIAGSGNLFTDSVEVDILEINITNP